jgi:hypothetical protein
MVFVDAIAWIAATDTNGTVDANGYYPPRMPDLVASSGSIPGLTYCWKLSVINHGIHGPSGNPYRDFDTGTSLTTAQLNELENVNETGTAGYSDDIQVPLSGTNTQDSNAPDGWVHITDGTPWNIYQDNDWVAARERGFFGGDAILSLKILDSGSNVIVPEQDYNFRIAGENPSVTSTTGAGYCQSYINAICQGPSPNWNGVTNADGSWQTLLTKGAWFGYAIAKEETHEDGGRTYYNQFFDNGGQYHAVPGKEGVPDWNNDTTSAPGTGGYGLFQLTLQGGGPHHADPNFIMPRAWLWNWQSNVQAFLPMISQKINYTHYYINAAESHLSAPDPSGDTCVVDTTTLPFWDSSVITIYNLPTQYITWQTVNKTTGVKETHRVGGGWQYMARSWSVKRNAMDYLGKVVRIGMEGKEQ